ncbi:MAG: hypothetical protein IJH63_00350 [Methanobrevibacter sp.]|nr:hypothetical protein [Methanosphaera sp.]MBR0369154.1 hypothetical protein [Methanobrevibacter sp.]
MPINKIPGVYYDEDVTYELTGEGSKIPVIIGATGNTYDEENNPTYKIDGTQIRKYSGWDEVNVATNATNPGIGVWTENTTNQLSNFLKEFFEEAKLQANDDIGVPHIYVIDVGDGKTKQSWLNAIDLAKSKLDATIEAYIGCDTITGYTIKDFITGVSTKLKECTVELDLRTGFTTKGYSNPSSVTDADLIALTGSSTGNQESRIGIMEPLLAGKTFARICVTPANTEPGFFEYRSVEPGTFKDRTRAQMLALQNAGIIFNRDEHINGNVYPKINLCVSSAFASNPRPADAMFHARFNADDLLREVFEACYSQIKANESATNIAYLQTRINKIVNDRVSSEEMIQYDEKTGKGTKLIATPSDANPYSIIISGQMQPQKCTVAIEVTATLVI